MKKMLKQVVLLISVLCALTVQTAFAATYTVRAGDTLSRIAQNHGVSISELLAANPNITNPSLIYVGQRIAIPETKLVSYTVQRGDTMWGIAKSLRSASPNCRKQTRRSRIFRKYLSDKKIMIPDTKALSSHEQQVFELVNQERARRGLPLLKLNTELSRVARIKNRI